MIKPGRIVYLLLFIGLMISAPGFAADTQKAPPTATDYYLDIDEALYPDRSIRSFVPEEYMVRSLDELEQHAARLPQGARITWQPGKYDSSNRPLLYGNAKSYDLFVAFCHDHGIRLAIAAPRCAKDEECKAFCSKAGEGKECLPQGLPVCSNTLCTCSLICL